MISHHDTLIDQWRREQGFDPSASVPWDQTVIGAVRGGLAGLALVVIAIGVFVLH